MWHLIDKGIAPRNGSARTGDLVRHLGGEDLENLTGSVSIEACDIVKGGNPQQALIAADVSLYQAKQNGRAHLKIAV